MRMVMLFALAAVCAAQGPQNGSIGGVVKTLTGAPVAEVPVSTYINARFANGAIFMSADTKDVRVFTDAQGRYRLADLPPGTYRVSVRGKGSFTPFGEKNVVVRSGQDVAVDFAIPAAAAIAGKVIDQNKEPVPNAQVYLVSKGYGAGGLGYFVRDAAMTDDQGEYTLQRAEVGQPYLIAAAKRQPLPAISEAPANLKLRKQAYVPTYYPNAPGPEGGASITLRSGERREGMDLTLLRAPSFCVEGVLESGTGPGPGRFWIAGSEYSYGASPMGSGLVQMPPNGTAGPDGKFRICDLRAGAYRLTAHFPQPGDPKGPAQYGTVPLTITDHDITNLRVIAGPGLPLAGTVVWDGAAPEPPLTFTVSVYLGSVHRAMGIQGEGSTSARTTAPGEFRMTGILMDDYTVRVNANAPGVYVKDIIYGTSSVRYEPLHLGTAMGDGGLRVVLARDGGSIAVRVTDKDGNGLPDVHVAILPAEPESEAMLAAALVRGETDQEGNYSYGVLAPGKYLVLATDARVDRGADAIGKLWAARARAKVVELRPNGSAQVTMERTTLE